MSVAPPGGPAWHSLPSGTPVRLGSASRHHRDRSGGEAAGRPVLGVIVRVKQCKGRGFDKQAAASAERLKRSTTM